MAFVIATERKTEPKDCHKVLHPDTFVIYFLSRILQQSNPWMCNLILEVCCFLKCITKQSKCTPGGLARETVQWLRVFAPLAEEQISVSSNCVNWHKHIHTNNNIHNLETIYI